jgi:hypothetical protein
MNIPTPIEQRLRQEAIHLTIDMFTTNKELVVIVVVEAS